MKLVTLLATFVCFTAGSTCQSQDFPVGSQSDGSETIRNDDVSVSIHAPTAAERNASVATTKLLLAENGKSLLPIVIAHKASDSTKSAAAELAHYLQRVTGATFAVITPDGQPANLEVKELRFPSQREKAKPIEAARRAMPVEPLPESGIVLGTLDEFTVPQLAGPLAIRDSFNGREAYAIRVQPKSLLLIGATERAVSHAAFRFLETLGLRWFFPGKNWEVVPAQPRLVYGLNVTDRPTILARRIWYAWGLFDGDAKSAYEAWSRHNLMAESVTINAGHIWQEIVRSNEAAFRVHPEYFAEIGGKRQQFRLDKEGKPLIDAKTGVPQLNLFAKVELGNPAVRKMIVDYALDYFHKNPNADMVSLDPSDGGGFSESAESKALGTISDAVFGIANEAARAVAQEFPGKMVGLLAYNYHIAPPSFSLEPNVYVQLTAGFNESRFTYQELFKMWPKKVRNLGFYEYFSTWLWDEDKFPGGRVASLDWVEERLPFYASLNATSIDAESGNNWGIHGLGYYLANRLMWNPQANADAIVTDFYEKAFGPAAPAMRRYYERVNPDSKNIVSANFIGQAFRDVEEATRLAKDRPDVLARIRDIKHYLRYVHLRWMYDNETSKEKRKELALAAFRHVYSTRYAYMNHWAGLSGTQGWIYNVAREFKDITLLPKWTRTNPQLVEWTGDRTAPQPWEDATEPTATQTEATFQEGLEYFPVTNIQEIDFPRTDLVPVKLDVPAPNPKYALRGAPADGFIEFYHQGGPRYVFHSRAGEPIKIEVLAGVIPHYRGRSDAAWTLFKLENKGGEKSVAQGQVPLDNTVRPLSIAVPSSGNYAFDFVDRGAGWRLRVPLGQPVVVPLRRDTGPMVTTGMTQAVFYVPEGTRQIQFFWASYQRSPIIIQPDGTAVLTGKNNEVVTIPVPAGMDGKLWRFHGMDLRHLWFFNLPNVVAPTADMMMLPRAVAQEDSLALHD